MSTLDLDCDLDLRVRCLEQQWREAFETSIVARTEYRSLASQTKVDLMTLEQAWERFEQCEAHKSQILTQLDRLQHRYPGGR